METMTIEEIKEYLPHRYPFLLVDRVVEFEQDRRIVAAEERHRQRAVLPGAFPAFRRDAGRADHRGDGAGGRTALAASLGQKNDGKSVYYFVGIDGARFKRPVTPGDQLVLEVEQLRRRARHGEVQGRGPGGRGRRLGGRAPLHAAAHRLRTRPAMSAIHPTAIVDPRARLAAGVSVGPYTRDRRRRRGGRGHHDRRALRADRPHDDRPRQPHLPLLLDRRGQPGQEVPGRAHAPRDRRPQHHPRILLAQPRHRAGRGRDAPWATTTGSWPTATSRTTARWATTRSSPTTPRSPATSTIGDHTVLGGFTGVHQFVKIGAHVMAGVSSRGAAGHPALRHRRGPSLRARTASTARASSAAASRPRRSRRSSAPTGRSTSPASRSPTAKAELERQAEAAPEVRALVDFLATSTRGIVR